MAKIDVTKEKIAYLKLWVGIAVVTDLSLFSWLLTRSGESIILIVFASVGVMAITGFTFYIHRRIERHIRDLEDL